VPVPVNRFCLRALVESGLRRTGVFPLRRPKVPPDTSFLYGHRLLL